jgi:hypothetical protein
MSAIRLATTIAVCAACLALAPAARAQTVDVGAHVTHLDLGVFDSSTWSVGGRIGWEVLPLVTLDGEVNVLPRDSGAGGSLVQALGGIKLGGRNPTFGLFAKLRPGFVRFNRDFIQPGTACVAVFPTPRECLATRTNAALDFGSVIEVYPSSRLIVRVDLGTTYIWYGSRGDARSRRYGNFQLGLGAAVRF